MIFRLGFLLKEEEMSKLSEYAEVEKWHKEKKEVLFLRGCRSISKLKNDEQNHQFNLLQTFQHFHGPLKPTIIKNLLKGTTRVLHSIQSECNLL